MGRPQRDNWAPKYVKWELSRIPTSNSSPKLITSTIGFLDIIVCRIKQSFILSANSIAISNNVPKREASAERKSASPAAQAWSIPDEGSFRSDNLRRKS